MMRKHATRILLLAVVFVSLGVVIYKVAENLALQKIGEIEQNPMKILDLVPESALRIKEFRRSKVEGGRKVWELTGKEAVYLKAEREAVIKKPWLVFYRETGETMEVNGDEGHLFFNDRGMEKMRLQGSVEVNYQGFILRTDEILYLQDDDRVMSPGKVTVSGKGLELEGEGMEISIRDEKIRFFNKVKTRIQPDQFEKKRLASES
ncbi:MAG: LPS export ABC transporter periplasmic protein LptC [Deltaproteobacteria bacterium]|nr:LPS export ABC transporter periplasmic protein LptC [Deltaproteobacteria bacterium]